MLSTDIFEQTHEPHKSRIVAGFDGVLHTGCCSVGRIVGDARTIGAVVAQNVTEEDQWQIVNLKGTKDGADHFDSVAVLGVCDEDEAIRLAETHFGCLFDGVGTEVLESNTHGLKRYLDNKYYNQNHGAVIPWALEKMQDVLTTEKPLWDGINLISHHGNVSNLIFDMTMNDDHKGLINPSQGLSAVLEEVGAEQAEFDSIIVEYQYLERMMNMLHAAMNNAATDKLQVSNMTISKPFKRNKVAQVAVEYALSDGQTATILFHNPDSTPAKLGAKDTLLSWKILVNSRDVTGAVQPNQGQGIAMPILAGRLMGLLAKNSARYQRTQARKAIQADELAQAEQRIQAKQDDLTSINGEIDALKTRIDEIKIAQSKKPVVEPEPVQELENSAVGDQAKTVDDENMLIGNTFLDRNMPLSIDGVSVVIHAVRVGDKQLEKRMENYLLNRFPKVKDRLEQVKEAARNGKKAEGQTIETDYGSKIRVAEKFLSKDGIDADDEATKYLRGVFEKMIVDNERFLNESGGNRVNNAAEAIKEIRTLNDPVQGKEYREKAITAFLKGVKRTYRNKSLENFNSLTMNLNLMIKDAKKADREGVYSRYNKYKKECEYILEIKESNASKITAFIAELEESESKRNELKDSQLAEPFLKYVKIEKGEASKADSFFFEKRATRLEAIEAVRKMVDEADAYLQQTHELAKARLKELEDTFELAKKEIVNASKTVIDGEEVDLETLESKMEIIMNGRNSVDLSLDEHEEVRDLKYKITSIKRAQLVEKMKDLASYDWEYQSELKDNLRDLDKTLAREIPIEQKTESNILEGTYNTINISHLSSSQLLLILRYAIEIGDSKWEKFARTYTRACVQAKRFDEEIAKSIIEKAEKITDGDMSKEEKMEIYNNDLNVTKYSYRKKPYRLDYTEAMLNDLFKNIQTDRKRRINALKKAENVKNPRTKKSIFYS